MGVIYFFEPKYIISYVVLLLFIVVLTYSKFYETYLMPLMNKWFFSEKHLHTMLQNPNGIQQINDVNFHNWVKQLGQDNHEEVEEIE